MRILFVILILTSICFSPTEQNETIEKQLQGIWEPIEFKKGIFMFKKKKRVNKKRQTYHFKGNAKIFMRLGGKMCGSSYVLYNDEIAQWTISSDSILTIRHEYSTMIYKRNFKFIKVDNSKLFLKKLEDKEIRK